MTRPAPFASLPAVDQGASLGPGSAGPAVLKVRLERFWAREKASLPATAFCPDRWSGWQPEWRRTGHRQTRRGRPGLVGAGRALIAEGVELGEGPQQHPGRATGRSRPRPPACRGMAPASFFCWSRSLSPDEGSLDNPLGRDHRTGVILAPGGLAVSRADLAGWRALSMDCSVSIMPLKPSAAEPPACACCPDPWWRTRLPPLIGLGYVHAAGGSPGTTSLF